MERIIVRRGRIVTYELLRKIFGGDPNVEIMWDRRRASASDAAPGHERRSKPPAQWFLLDYLFTSGRQAMLTPPPADEAQDDSQKPSSE